MSGAPDILANTARGWNRDPAGVALGTERTGVSAALWTHDVDDVQEVWADPDPTRHLLCCCAPRNMGDRAPNRRRPIAVCGAGLRQSIAARPHLR